MEQRRRAGHADLVIASSEARRTRRPRRSRSTTPRWPARWPLQVEAARDRGPGRAARLTADERPRRPGRAGAATELVPARAGRGVPRCTPPPARLAEARLLVEAMLAEHRRSWRSSTPLAATDRPGAPRPGWRRALQALFEVAPGQGERAGPAAAGRRPGRSRSPSCSAGMHELLGGERRPRARPPGRRWRRRATRCTLRRGRPAELPGARRPRDPARDPARHDLRRPGRRAPRARAGPRRPARPAAAAGAARAPRARRLRRGLPRARARGLAPGAGPDDGLIGPQVDPRPLAHGDVREQATRTRCTR